MRARSDNGKFTKVPASTAERMAELGITVPEMYVLKLVVSHDYHPDWAVRFVRKYCGVDVDVKELYHKLAKTTIY